MSLWLTYDRVKNYLQISQSAYSKKALKMFGLEHLKGSSTPFATVLSSLELICQKSSTPRRRNCFNV